MRIYSKMAKSRRRGPKDSCIKQVKVFNILLFFFLIRLPLSPLGCPGVCGVKENTLTRSPTPWAAILCRGEFCAWSVFFRFTHKILLYRGSQLNCVPTKSMQLGVYSDILSLAGCMGHYCQYASRVPDSGCTMLVRASRRKFLSFGAWLERYYRLLLSYSGSFNLFRAICPNGTIVVSTQSVKVIIRP